MVKGERLRTGTIHATYIPVGARFSLGQVMLAIEIARHGGPDVLVPVEQPDPVPAAGEVLVQNQCIGVNYVDLQHREGQPYPVWLIVHLGVAADR